MTYNDIQHNIHAYHTIHTIQYIQYLQHLGKILRGRPQVLRLLVVRHGAGPTMMLVAHKRHHGSDPFSRGPVHGRDKEQKFDDAVVDGRVAGLEDVDVQAPHAFLHLPEEGGKGVFFCM